MQIHYTAAASKWLMTRKTRISFSASAIVVTWAASTINTGQVRGTVLLLLTRSPGWGHAVSVIRAKSCAAENIHNIAAIGVHRDNVECAIREIGDVVREPVADERNFAPIRRVGCVKVVMEPLQRCQRLQSGAIQIHHKVFIG